MSVLTRVRCSRGTLLCATFRRRISSVKQKNERDFMKLKNEWWIPRGEFEVLSRMNKLRVPLITDVLRECREGDHGEQPMNLLKGYKIIDVGCGGGLLTEPLARLGAAVTGLDIVETNIDTARAHADKDPKISDRITYVCGRIEDMKEQFDALVASEVIEHVESVELFIKHCSRVVKPRGHLFFTTINRTLLSLLIAKIGAEYIFNCVPRGLHDWRLFVTPEELQLQLAKHNCAVARTKGMMYNPITGQWRWIDTEAVSYALHAVKVS
ncbi:ubiquinone biosynthesis O-methyltransferase, mitochondrial-like isoform X1 [Varroa jacobsoni]|uniref:ubiquinone biosynthesis O-methyltransferase, mitochondrial-like isoform X1 n=1 Tax=Varroa jacobsoni TaxID=62625 RepID=UPI000BF7B558|nr:ubiquinone biosynthesis O-methyltransferase, mitochondrial-like isoform X1 [Varroa jacobsoni]XP_022697396.1 ubiquinone biosynthesis O-methyltransferase, mitochondrial-like isoform X1 [Varroa jacobsoni]XP_022697397.1 ubiquinone biosynthesis O-methyltransferase, mitochondrial-like isoform X1 [Varroa jacobsoni]